VERFKEFWSKFGTKKAIVFFTLIPVLTIFSLIRTECPVCGGTGQLASLPGMEYVEILRYSSEELYVTREICEAFIVYKYKLAIELQNEGDQETEGYIKLILKEYITGNVIDIQYVSVAIAAKTIMETDYTVYFGTGIDIPGKTEISAEVVTGEIEDTVCDGTGSVPINLAFLINGFKDSFLEEARSIKQYKPPVYYPPDEGWAE